MSDVGPQKDYLQSNISNFAIMWKEYSDLLEAFELIYVERVHLEEIMVCEDKLESLDDLELVGQYFHSLQDSQEVPNLISNNNMNF